MRLHSSLFRLPSTSRISRLRRALLMSVASVVAGLFLSGPAAAAPDIGFDGAEIAAEAARGEALPSYMIAPGSLANASVPLPTLESLRDGLARLRTLDPFLDLANGGLPAAARDGLEQVFLAAPSRAAASFETTGSIGMVPPDALANLRAGLPIELLNGWAETAVAYAGHSIGAFGELTSGLSQAETKAAPAEVAETHFWAATGLGPLPEERFDGAASAPTLRPAPAELLMEALARVQQTGVPSPSVLPEGVETAAGILREFVAPYLAAGNTLSPEEMLAQSLQPTPDEHDSTVTSSVPAMPAREFDPPQSDIPTGFDAATPHAPPVLVDELISTWRSVVAAIEAARRNPLPEDVTAQPDHVVPPMLDETVTASIPRLSTPDVPELPDALPRDIADFVQPKPDPAPDAGVAAAPADAAEPPVVRRNPFPEETTAQPEHAPPRAGDELTTGSVPALPAPDFAALPDSMPADISVAEDPDPAADAVASALRVFAARIRALRSYPFPEETTPQPEYVPPSSADDPATGSIPAMPTPDFAALPEALPADIEVTAMVEPAPEATVAALRAYAARLKALRSNPFPEETTAQPEHVPPPAGDDLATGAIPALPAPDFAELPDALPVDIEVAAKAEPVPDATVAALRAYAARLKAARSNPFPEETTAQPEHVPPPAEDDLATGPIPALPAPDFAALPEALPADIEIAARPAPAPDATVPALRALAFRFKAVRGNPHPEELTVQPQAEPLPKVDAVETGAIRKPGGKSAERLSPHRIAWLADPTPARAPAPALAVTPTSELTVAQPAIATPDELPVPKLRPVFDRIRLLRQAALVDARTLQGDGLKLRLVGFEMPAADAMCTRVDGVKESCRDRIATLIELMIQRRQLTCRYQQPEGSEIAYGHCRVGSADLGEAVVARGYAKRGIAAPAEIAPRDDEPAATPALNTRPTPAATPRAVQAQRTPPRMHFVTTWPSGPNGPKVVSLRPARASGPQVVAQEPSGQGGPRVVSIRPGKLTPRVVQTRAPERKLERPLDLSVPRFVRFADVKPE
jgi:hypothetical protein